MKVIRDEQLNGILMIPLFTQWGINRCNVKDCKEKHTTIIEGAINQPFGLCEKHYSECKEAGKINFTLIFD